MKKNIFLPAVLLVFATVYPLSAEKKSNVDAVRIFLGPHYEIESIVSKKSGVNIDYTGISLYTDRQILTILDNNLQHIEEFEDSQKDFVYSIPYFYDDCVMVCRIQNYTEILMNYENMMYSTYKKDPLRVFCCQSLGIKNFDDSYDSAATVLKNIVDKKADYTFLPLRFANFLVEELGYEDKFYISRPVFSLAFRFVVPRQNYLDVEKINNAIVQMKYSKEMDEIYSKYKVEVRTMARSENNVIGIVIIAVLVLMLFVAVFVLLNFKNEYQGRLF